jgi:predicted anti-sigma-YlaC factor YlaD
VNCDDLKSVLSDYLDEEAATELCHEVERHLKDCGPCEVEIDALKKTILIYRSNTECVQLSDGARERLYTKLTYEYRVTRRDGSL